jgi:hypothetical protein
MIFPLSGSFKCSQSGLHKPLNNGSGPVHPDISHFRVAVPFTVLYLRASLVETPSIEYPVLQEYVAVELNPLFLGEKVTFGSAMVRQTMLRNNITY